MSEISVQLEGGRSAQVPAGATVAEALKAADRDAAKQALAAKVNGREVDLSAKLDESAADGEPVRVGSGRVAVGRCASRTGDVPGRAGRRGRCARDVP